MLALGLCCPWQLLWSSEFGPLGSASQATIEQESEDITRAQHQNVHIDDPCWRLKSSRCNHAVVWHLSGSPFSQEMTLDTID